MANIKEKDLPVASSIASTDYFRIVDASGASKKAQVKSPAFLTITKTSSKLNSVTGIGLCDPLSGTVRIYFTFSATQNIAITDVLFTVPSGYRPSASITFPILIATDSAFVGGWGYVQTNGEVTQGVTGFARNGFGAIEYKL